MVNNQGLAIALALLVVLAPAPMVSARERNMKLVVTTAEGRILYSEWVSPGDEFEIVFTHLSTAHPSYRKVSRAG